jgi:restriction system protein
VTLTPRSGDKGRDAIAVTSQIGAVKVLDQAKANRAGNLVKQKDVRDLLGVIALDQSASKGVITTTSDFPPGVMDEFDKVMSYRLETKNGEQFVKWVKDILLGPADAPRPAPQRKMPPSDSLKTWPY